MDRILIRGGVPLSGTINIGGAKNAALPLMAASLLTADPLGLANLPDLADITTMANLLEQHGAASACRRQRDRSGRHQDNGQPPGAARRCDRHRRPKWRRRFGGMAGTGARI